MNKEEKKAMESLIEIREFANLSNYLDIKITQLNAIDIVLNLIEKQQSKLEVQDIFIKEEAKLNEELKVELRKKDNKIASKNKEIKLLKDIHNKHVTIIKKQQKETEEKINKAQYVINEYETYIKYLEERKK